MFGSKFWENKFGKQFILDENLERQMGNKFF